MVTRKSLPKLAEGGASGSSTGPPRMQDMRQELWSATESEDSEDKVWAEEPRKSFGKDAVSADDVPDSLRPGIPVNYASLSTEENVWNQPNPTEPAGGGSQAGADVQRVPTILRPGAGGGGQIEQDVNRVPTILQPGGRTETNPFKRKPIGGGSREPSKITAPSAENQPAAPASSFSQLSLNETGGNPWQPSQGDKLADLTPPIIPAAPEPDLGKDAWSSAKPSRQPSPRQSSVSPALISLPSEGESAGWEEESRKMPSPAPQVPPPEEDVLEDAHAWDDLGSLDKGKAKAKPVPVVAGGAAIDDWNLIDVEAPPGPPSKQSTWENFEDAEEAPEPSPGKESSAQKPSLPSRESSEAPPAKPPRPAGSSQTGTYQIKNINWQDANAGNATRTSPILVQNANGPCPLVALVNALTLTTPAEMTNTALVETLRSREQVSLGLLLDAVFDELMSPRRNRPGVDLPDVTELYDFLKGLHTGMNVNPRFVPTEEVMKAFKRTSLTHLHPSERADMVPGTFEDTKEMNLYSTFSIPLIHGWLPPTSEPAYEALARRAASYEDAQNLLFREEELEEKLSGGEPNGLSQEEQEIYQDVLTIKSFLSISATQLTPWGLDVIKKAMRPGSVAILFRNDHFSTLYRQPQTLELLTLVTDAGYAGHEEIVWESLVDINGERAEFFSGDFRLVGGASHQQQHNPNASGGGSGWTTVQGGRRGRNQGASNSASISAEDEPPLSPTLEQEDRDLALALQLQEEEDERHRAAEARRRQESMLSEQFIEQQARQAPVTGDRGRGGSRGGRGGRGAAAAPGRRTSSVTSIPVTQAPSTPVRGRGGVVQNVRSLIPPRSQPISRPADEGVGDAPPSYEQASLSTPYIPPQGHPSHPASSPGSTSSQMVAPAAPPVGRVPTSPAGPSRPLRQGVPPSPTGGRDKDCVVM